MEQVRLDRFLANSGCGTRTDVKKLIKSGCVLVGSRPETDPGRKICPGEDMVTVSGRQISASGMRYYMLNKAAGTISATRDAAQKTVLDLLPERRDDLFPVGRLDLDTEGLLLITNDGALAHRLTAPAWHVNKTYEAVVTGTITQAAVDAFREGLDIGDERRTLSAKLSEITDEAHCRELYTSMQRICDANRSRADILQDADGVLPEKREGPEDPEGAVSCVQVTIREGRFHQIKRMFEAVGEKVLYLRRVQMGPLILDTGLAVGESRMLTEQEIQALRRCVERKNSDKIRSKELEG